MIITNRYRLEKQGAACFPSRVERSIRLAPFAAKKHIPMDAAEGSLF